MTKDTEQKQGKTWQRTLGTALGVCIVAWLSALLLMFMVWSLLWVYTNLFG